MLSVTQTNELLTRPGLGNLQLSSFLINANRWGQSELYDVLPNLLFSLIKDVSFVADLQPFLFSAFGSRVNRAQNRGRVHKSSNIIFRDSRLATRSRLCTPKLKLTQLRSQ